jgi:hypothetical protein
VAEKKFLVDLNLSGNKAKNFRLEDYADNTAPTSNFVGRMIYTTNSTNPDRVEVYNGSDWKALAYTDDVPAVSLSLTAPDLFTVSGSPAAYNGTLDFEWNVVAVNTVLSGPSTGSTEAIPTFRSLVAADIPSITSSKISNFQEAVEDTAGNLIASSTHDGVSVEYGDPAGTLVITNTDKGSSQNIFKTIAVTGQTSVAADSNTDTLTLAGSTGLTVTTDASTDTITFTNSGVTGIQGTPEEITVDNGEAASSAPFIAGNITVGLPVDVAIVGNLKVGGDLDIVGAINSFSTTTIKVEDNKFLLNSNVTGVPTLDAGIEVERGDYTNALLYWNETANGWYVGTPGDSSDAATITALSLSGHTHSTGDITGLQEYVEDTIATSLTDSGTIDFTYTDNSTSAGTITADIILATSNPYLSTTSGLAVDISALETKLTTDGYAKKYTTTIGDGTAQTFAVTHSLSTRAVTVSVYETASPYAEVEAEVLHTSTSVVTINTNSVPTSGQYTVVVVG